MKHKTKTLLSVALLAAFLLLAVFAYQRFSPRMQPQANLGEASEDAKADYHKISAEEANKMLAEHADAILLDVRTEDEFKAQRIEGAILIPDYEIKDRAEAELPHKDALILLYCRSGNRSKTAAQVLASMGYTKVYDFGGIISYPYETISD